jgi:CRP/FNR family cyclic AMP-dependent transcriptional regulator
MPQGPVEKVFQPGQYLFNEGDPSNSLFLIKTGSIAILKRKGSAFVELGKLYSGEVLGELSFFDRRPRSASAVALTEVEILEITFDSLDTIYRPIPDYMKTIMTSVATRLRKANEMIRSLQKEVISEVRHSRKPDEFSAADALAATTPSNRAAQQSVDVPSDVPISSLDTSGSGTEHKK